MQASWTQSLFVFGALSLSWVVLEAIRRLFFSNIAHIPGPRLAALSSWYEFYYDVVKPGQYVWKIKELHKEYAHYDEGPIIRVSPWEVHVKDVDFLDDIYAPSFRRREKYSFQTRTLKVPMSVGGSMNHELHRKRREALNPFFSKRSVLALGSMIAGKVDLLCASLERHVKDGTPVNLSDIYFAFANE
ncbi:MAG: hypothetical protein Q9191_003597 [Dirinaria sp. TL-2023a]